MTRFLTFYLFLMAISVVKAQTIPRDEYLSLGYGVTYGLYQRQYDDGDLSTKSNSFLFRPVVFNLRYGSSINNKLEFIVNMQYAWNSQTTGDIIEGISNWLFTGGLIRQLPEKNIYISGKAGFAIIRKAVGGTLIPGVGLKLSENWRLETEAVFAQTVIDYNFTNFGLADLRLILLYHF